MPALQHSAFLILQSAGFAQNIKGPTKSDEFGHTQASQCTGLHVPTLQKHLGYFNHFFRLSQLHQCDQGM